MASMDSGMNMTQRDQRERRDHRDQRDGGGQRRGRSDQPSSQSRSGGDRLMKQANTDTAGVKGTGTVSDPIADMLTRIRNAAEARHANVKVPVSKIKREIAKILHEEGYIRGFQLVGKGQSLRIRLKYNANREPVLRGLKRVSKPGRRVYVQKDKLPRVFGGLGVAIVTTSQGIMTAREARRRGIGGEVIGYIW